MSKLLKPEGYQRALDLKQTELAIKKIKDFFLSSLSTEIRLKRSTSWENQDVYIPCASIYNYFENMQMNDKTVFIYLNAYNYGWCNLHFDEMKAKGRFELTFKLPPVPRRNTYELRYKVLPNGDRGVQQFYFDSHEKEFYMDYLELCPKEVYDNPNTPEDIW